MMKQGDSVIVSRLEGKRRQRTIHDDPKICDGDWVQEKSVLVERKGVVGSLHLLAVVVTLANGDYKGCKYTDLTFLKGGKVSFKSRLPSWKGIKAGKEVLIIGREITLKGTINWNRVFIPVTIDGKPSQIPYEQLKFKKETK